MADLTKKELEEKAARIKEYQKSSEHWQKQYTQAAQPLRDYQKEPLPKNPST